MKSKQHLNNAKETRNRVYCLSNVEPVKHSGFTCGIKANNDKSSFIFSHFGSKPATERRPHLELCPKILGLIIRSSEIFLAKISVFVYLELRL
jgi:hypothetical protein